MKKYIYVVLAAVVVAGCTAREELLPNPVEQPASPGVLIENQRVYEKDLQQGVIYIKTTPEFATQLEQKTDKDGNVMLSAVSCLTKASSAMGVVKMKRLFPYAGRFEARTRAEGLHQWYMIEYDDVVSVTRAVDELKSLPGLEIIEPVPQIRMVGSPDVAEYVEMTSREPRSTAATDVFNDPLLGDQWHYYNTGSNAKSAIGGCDVNCVPVWKAGTVGSPDIIVGVVDTGVDYTHEDLADNMWKNPEKTGKGMDCGYNFCNDNYMIEVGDHGTHVSGTIAAVNNNGIGVCGIAGGDAKKGKGGVKIMSCQIFGSKSGSGVQAIKWSADHGAVISQNSWGLTGPASTSDAMKAAVDYFIKYAGLDENGKQVGPMAGGLAIFSSGNDDSIIPYGNDYDKMVIVSALGADYMRSYYSNYGPWVHISAPGGDAKKGNQIISTLPGNKYGRMQGTSMACPHVSGVAALVLSKYAGKGFTSAALRDKLLNNTTDISAYNRAWEMGAGLVNAYKAIASGGGTPPNKVTSLQLSVQSNNITFSAEVPSDPDDGTPNTIQVYYSTESISTLSDAMFAVAYVGSAKKGDTITGTITGLEFNTKYYVKAVAVDLAGNVSTPTSQQTIMTGENSAPFITPTSPLTYTFKPHEASRLKFNFGDPDGHYTSIELVSGSEAEVLDTMDFANPSVVLTAKNAETGTYNGKVRVTDYYGLKDSLEYSYTVLENHAPVTKATMPDQTFGKRAQVVQFNETDYFFDEDGERLNYVIDNSNINVVNVTYSEGVFYMTSMGYGYSTVTITGTDVREKSVSQTFKVLVRDASQDADVYPNPVKTNLYIRTASEGDVAVKVVAANGSIFFDDTVHVSPFEPAVIDMSKAAPGMYTVKLNVGGKELIYSIVKV